MKLIRQPSSITTIILGERGQTEGRNRSHQEAKRGRFRFTRPGFRSRQDGLATAQQQSETIVAFASLGVKVNITELDVDVLPRASQHRGADISLNVELRAELNPYANGLPDSVQQALAKRYAELFAVFASMATSSIE
jgi:hypothetical protein